MTPIPLPKRKRVFGYFSFIFLFIWILGSVNSVLAGDKELKRDSPLVHFYFSKGKHTHAAEWGYEGKQGPEYWGTLSPHYHLAKDGKQQSPIDIQSKKAISESLPPLKFDYQKERISAINNGHSIQHDEQPGSFLHVGDHVYSLEQFHVHVPSEHTIDGKHADAEIHFVHKSPAGKVAVLAVLVQADSQNPVNAPINTIIPQHAGESVAVDQVTRDPMELIPKDHSYWQYRGSFTTPPCTEGVDWIVMKNSISTTPEILEKFRKIIGGNNRPVQGLYGRKIMVSTSSRMPE